MLSSSGLCLSTLCFLVSQWVATCRRPEMRKLDFKPSPVPLPRLSCIAGMRCLKIPNTRAFHNITKIKDAQDLFDRLQARPPFSLLQL